MSSLSTDMSAMSSVQNLTATQKSLADIEAQIATGLRIRQPKDNAAYWSIATSMRTSNIANSAVADCLNLGASILGTATSALNNVVSIMQKMVADYTAAQTATGSDLDKIGTDVRTLQAQILSTVDSASFNGVNLLYQPLGTTREQIATSIAGGGTTFQVKTLAIDLTQTALLSAGGSSGLLEVAGAYSQTAFQSYAVSASVSAAMLRDVLKDVSVTLGSVQTIAAVLGAYQADVELQSSFLDMLRDSITSGIGALEDSDMNRNFSRIDALLIQEDLGVEALAVANQNSRMILKLFRGESLP